MTEPTPATDVAPLAVFLTVLFIFLRGIHVIEWSWVWLVAPVLFSKMLDGLIDVIAP